ncbi:uncharacterized protein LOC120634088 [Pararge aegeria]|uniref:Jg18225 protein n=1 Tax=Pararge aegeria aegeria TaxID=348720 RepID=A0A8S4RGH0_9NEOP|nr:uncharacterized protein LOC120634088 [Pararge aegeria]CAH2234559.1 jg18225 [Pararge aegeria aegeria]
MYRETFVSTLLVNVVFSSLLSGDFDIADGVKLVSIPDNGLDDEGRSLGDAPLYRMAKFLQSHELHVKLPNLIEKDKLSKIFSESLKAIDDSYKEKNATGRGSKGDGGGSLALLGLMFAKTLGAVGIGGLGLLTMKALAVSALALMLSAIVGVKKLSSHDDHDDHQVIYAGHHGSHRRRRDTPLPYQALPYQGWTGVKRQV